MSDVTLRTLLVGEDRSASKSIKGVGDEAQKTSGKMKQGFSSAGQVMKGALGADIVMEASHAIVSFGKDSIDAFAELEDSTAAASVIFGKNMKSIIAQSETANSTLGMSKQQVINAANTFGTFGKSAKLSGKDLADFSMDMTSLAGDMASFKGTTPEEAIQAVGAALRGETEPIRKYGVLLDDASLRQQALKQGLVKTTKDALTPQNKVLAAASLMFMQTKDAQGDFARTANSTANTMKTQTAKFEDLQATIGQKLAPAMTQVLTLGNQMIDWITQNVDWLGPLAAGLAGTIAAFAALNVVMAANPIGLIVVAIGALVGGLIWAYQNVEWFRNGVDAAFKVIGDVARWLWNNALAPMLRFLVTWFGYVMDNVANLLDALGNVPGFEWAKSAAVHLRVLGQRAREAASNIADIPDPKVDTGDSQKQIDALNIKIQSIKGKIVEAKAKGDAKEVERLKTKLDKLRNKKVQVEANVKKTGISTIKLKDIPGGGGLRISAYAKGGRPKVGELAMFHADELWVPDVAGTVLTKQRTQQLISSGPQELGETRTNGGDVFHINMDFRGATDGRKVARDFVSGLRSEVRARRGRPFDIKAFA